MTKTFAFIRPLPATIEFYIFLDGSAESQFIKKTTPKHFLEALDSSSQNSINDVSFTRLEELFAYAVGIDVEKKPNTQSAASLDIKDIKLDIKDLKSTTDGRTQLKLYNTKETALAAAQSDLKNNDITIIEIGVKRKSIPQTGPIPLELSQIQKLYSYDKNKKYQYTLDSDGKQTQSASTALKPK